MEDCTNFSCDRYNKFVDKNCMMRIEYIKECKNRTPLTTQKVSVAKLHCSDGLCAEELTEAGYYWWLPKCEMQRPHIKECWSVISWHPKVPSSMKGIFVGPLKTPST